MIYLGLADINFREYVTELAADLKKLEEENSGLFIKTCMYNHKQKIVIDKHKMSFNILYLKNL